MNLELKRCPLCQKEILPIMLILHGGRYQLNWYCDHSYGFKSKDGTPFQEDYTEKSKIYDPLPKGV